MMGDAILLMVAKREEHETAQRGTEKFHNAGMYNVAGDGHGDKPSRRRHL